MTKFLLGALTALVVARPLVPGDDPGRPRPTAGAGGLSLDLALLLLLTAWAGVRAVGRSAAAPGRVGGLLLLGVGVACFVSSQRGGRYERPGTFVAGEWLAVAAAFVLTRRLAGHADDARGLTAALLATAVSLGGFAAYQHVAERADWPTGTVAAPASLTPLAGDDEFEPRLDRPAVEPAEASAGFLVLLLPTAGATAVAAWRTRSPRGRALVAVLLIPALGSIAALGSMSFAGRFDGVGAALRLAADHPLTGVGPGNVTRHTAGVAAGGAWLDLAAGGGLIAVAVLVVALAALARTGRKTWVVADDEPPAAVEGGPRWEFYLGGVAGLVAGFVWAAGDMPAEAPPVAVWTLGYATCAARPSGSPLTAYCPVCGSAAGRSAGRCSSASG